MTAKHLQLHVIIIMQLLCILQFALYFMIFGFSVCKMPPNLWKLYWVVSTLKKHVLPLECAQVIKSFKL